VESKELINKEAKRVQFRILKPLSQAYNIVVYICKSAKRIKEFKKLARKIILLDNYIK
jgi:hypothetical protein